MPSAEKVSSGRSMTLNSLTLRFAKWLRYLIHPVVVFVTLQCLGVCVTILWVIWFLNQKEELSTIASALGQKNIDFSYGIFFLTLGCVLLGMILVGTVMLFIFAQKQTSLVHQQRNFVSSVTHELRSPLASLQLSFETLQKQNVPVEIRHQLNEMALSDIDRLARLVDRILISARLDRGIAGFDATLEEITMRNFTQEIIDASSHLDTDLSSRIHVNLPYDFSIWAPRQPLSLILRNLLENAVSYSPAKTLIEIKIQDEGTDFHLSVRDKGYGLNKKDLRRIFKMFHRTSAATKKAIPGTGLGLYIVKSMTKLMNGRVWAESSGIGEGATFHVVAPKKQKVNT